MHRNSGISFFIGLTCLLGVTCRQADEPSVTLISKDEKKVGMIIRGVEIEAEEISSDIQIQLVKPGERVAVLGEFTTNNGDIHFEPIVPFTEGLTYEIIVNGTLLSQIKIPSGGFASPKLLAIYPSEDTLPENLLKMYFEFSEPMVEGSSLSHITLVRSDGDTMNGTFLDLDPELWNTDGTVLTLWLDPGRIKRDLIPNKELGAPLQTNERYTLYVDKSWQSKKGLSLRQTRSKTFITGPRDDVSPSPSLWKVEVPSAATNEPLIVHFESPLDYFLVKNTITVKAGDGSMVSGNIEIDDDETIYRFIPATPWQVGQFVLQVESRLEDLAGNNLNRPFDRDVDGLTQTDNKQQAFFNKEFQIR